MLLLLGSTDRHAWNVSECPAIFLQPQFKGTCHTAATFATVSSNDDVTDTSAPFSDTSNKHSHLCPNNCHGQHSPITDAKPSNVGLKCGWWLCVWLTGMVEKSCWLTRWKGHGPHFTSSFHHNLAFLNRTPNLYTTWQIFIFKHHESTQFFKVGVRVGSSPVVTTLLSNPLLLL